MHSRPECEMKGNSQLHTPAASLHKEPSAYETELYKGPFCTPGQCKMFCVFVGNKIWCCFGVNLIFCNKGR
jgi:hypothetical protein